MLKPSALICRRSLRQSSFFARASRSSIGARALPPPYHTAIGKNLLVSGWLAVETVQQTVTAMMSAATRHSLSSMDGEYPSSPRWHFGCDCLLLSLPAHAGSLYWREANAAG